MGALEGPIGGRTKERGPGCEARVGGRGVPCAEFPDRVTARGWGGRGGERGLGEDSERWLAGTDRSVPASGVTGCGT